MLSKKVDKENDEVMYNDELHSYWDKIDNGKYVSVTTLIHNYANEFDEDFWSSYKALEHLYPEVFTNVKSILLKTRKFDYKLIQKLNLNEELFYSKKQEIIDGYNIARKTACERGTKIHSQFENEVYQTAKVPVKTYTFNKDFTCEPHYYKLDLDKGLYPEFLISKKSSDGILRVAGQIDLLVKDGNDIWIIDYKTNERIDKKSYYNRYTQSSVKMKYPLNTLDDCNFNHYQLQLSTYAYLLQQINPNFNIKGLLLKHIDHSGNETEIPCEYLKEEVEKMLKHYKRKIKMEYELSRDIPINY